MFAVFLCGLLLLTYALRGMKRERVCTPSWASHPPGTHLNIAIVTFSNEALQIKQKEKQQEVGKRSQAVGTVAKPSAGSMHRRPLDRQACG